MTANKWNDQASACREALRLVKLSDWPALEELTAVACGNFPDSLPLLGTRMSTLNNLNRAKEAAQLGMDFIENFREEETILRNLFAILPTLPKIELPWLPVLARLTSELGQALHVRALISARKGEDALEAYHQLNKHFPNQNLLSKTEFATRLAAADLFETAEQVLISMGKDALVESSHISSRVDLFLKLAGNGHSERFGEAKQLAEALLERNPLSADALYAMGRIWWDASRMDKALPYLRRLIEIVPNHPVRGGVVFNSIYDEEISPDVLFKVHLDWANTLMGTLPGDLPESPMPCDPDRRLRIGYISSDFGNHPVGYFAITTIPVHDREQVEIFLYSQRDPVIKDDTFSQEFRAAVGEGHWRWVRKLGDRELFDQVRSDKIDILVDLSGHTTGNRMIVFGMRAAPVQVSWLGYPHSTAMPTIDYRISDNIVEPEGECEKWSTEKIQRLPNGFHAIRMPKDIPEPSSPPCLVNGYLTFGSFNNVNKIGAHTIEMWAALLNEISGSRLILKHRTMNAFENREGIRSLFTFFGVDPKRLRFVGTTIGREEHFAMYSHMDIALDPLGYNGTTTTCEALYMGVPVLTLPGQKHAARVSASLLHRVGLDAWVAKDKGHYLKIASYASQNFDLLARRRARLRQDFLNSPLNDGQGLAKELEKAFRDMWYRACNSHSSNLNSK